MVRQANIGDIGKVAAILSHSYTEKELEGIYLYLSMEIRNVDRFLILIDESNSICLFIERIGNFKCQFHIYSTPESRGSHALLFGKLCLEWIFKNTQYTTFLTFITQRHVGLYARKMGMKPLGTVEGSGNKGEDEVLYVATKENMMNKLNIGGA